jgi:PAS domain-containing protein
MEKAFRKTGIDIIGDAPWGTHFCQFYETREDLVDILVPFFKAGLESNEFCMWITSEPLKVKDAKAALKKAVKNLDHFIKKGQIEILDYSEWYTKSGKFDADHVLRSWVEKENRALKRGYDGLRLSGNTFWLRERDWRNFTDYEKEVNKVIGKYRMIAVCAYPLAKCGASEVIDVVSNHQFALIRREGKWVIIESSARKRAEEELKKSAQLLRDTGEMAKVGAWELDLSTKEVLMTEEVCRIHGVEPGYKPKLEEAIKFYAPESVPALEATLKKTIETG